MRNIYVPFRALVLALPVAAALISAGCDDDDDFQSPVAPREATATPSPTATETARPTASPRPDGAGEATGFLGRISSVETSSMRVRGTDVFANADTLFFRNGEAAAFTDFSVGEDVRVAGTTQADGSVLASKVSLLPDPTPTPTPTPEPTPTP